MSGVLAAIIVIVIVAVVGGMIALYVGLDRSQKKRRESAGLGEADHLRQGDGTVGESLDDDDPA